MMHMLVTETGAYYMYLVIPSVRVNVIRAVAGGGGGPPPPQKKKTPKLPSPKMRKPPSFPAPPPSTQACPGQSGGLKRPPEPSTHFCAPPSMAIPGYGGGKGWGRKVQIGSLL